VDNAVWKIVFTGFGGSATGDFIFTKQMLLAAGINETENVPHFSLYPNPASNQVNLVFEASSNSEYSISDISGRLMQGGILSTQTLIHNLDISALNSGIYLITIKSDGSRRTERLIIR